MTNSDDHPVEDFPKLEGKTVESVESVKGKIVFRFDDGTVAHMHHRGGRFPYVEEVNDE